MGLRLLLACLAIGVNRLRRRCKASHNSGRRLPRFEGAEVGNLVGGLRLPEGRRALLSSGDPCTRRDEHIRREVLAMSGWVCLPTIDRNRQD
jgi:hypothetical protein